MNLATPVGNLNDSAPDYANRIALTLFFSALFHAFLLYGIHIKAPEPSKSERNMSTLDVVLVNSKSASKPVKADALAQANLDGGGNTDAKERAKSPLPAMDRDQPEREVKQASQKVQELEQKAQLLMTQLKSKDTAPVTPTPPQPEPEKAETPDTSQLVQRSMEMARLEAQIAQDWNAYQQRPRRKFVGARTQEFVFARYIEDWRVKVERVGNLNYPEAAKQQKLYGSLQLTVSIRADGSVEQVEVNRSSGHKVLDAAAVRIVELAAPYAPFSDEIRKKADILSITRTWTFTRSDRLTSE